MKRTERLFSNRANITTNRWTDIIQLARIIGHVSNIAYETWLKNLHFYDVSGDVIFVALDDVISDENCLYFVRNKYTNILELATTIVLGKSYTVYIDVASEIENNYFERLTIKSQAPN